MLPWYLVDSSHYFIQPDTSPPPSICSFSSKPCGDGRVATVTGAGWHWELLVMDLHTGGPSRMVAVFLTMKQEDTSVPLGWQSSLFQGQHCSPQWGTGLEKMTQTKLEMNVRIYQNIQMQYNIVFILHNFLIWLPS